VARRIYKICQRPWALIIDIVSFDYMKFDFFRFSIAAKWYDKKEDEK